MMKQPLLQATGLFATLEVPANQRLFFVGDIHGNYNALTQGLQKVEFNPADDVLVCTGDLIDRGTHSIECLKLTQQPWFHTVLGNHDFYAYDTVINQGHQYRTVWQHNGGKWWFQLAEDEKNTAKPLLEALFIQSTPLVMLIEHEGHGRFAVCHADFPQSTSLSTLTKELKAAHSQRPGEWVAAIVHHIELFSSRWLSGKLYQRLHKVVLEERQNLISTALDSLCLTEEVVQVVGVDAIFQGHTPIKGAPLFVGNRVLLDAGAWQDDEPLPIISSSEVMFHLGKY